MNDIILKTYELIDVLEDSEIIKNLVYYKNKLSSNKEILELVSKYNTTFDDLKLVKIMKKLYSNDDYKGFIDNYNKLHQILIKINYRYKKLFNSRSCRI